MNERFSRRLTEGQYGGSRYKMLAVGQRLIRISIAKAVTTNGLCT